MATTKRKRNRARQPKATYSNVYELRPNLMDCTLILGTQRPDVDNQQWMPDEHTEITLPWPVVKTLLYSMAGTLLGYEKQCGYVSVPHALIPATPTVDLVGGDGAAQMAMLKVDLFRPGHSQPEEPSLATVVSAATKGKLKH